MNVLFLTLVEFTTLQERNIYTDLLREFVANGHKVYVISPVERREHEKTCIINEENARVLRLAIGNTQKTNIIEKGISTIMIEPRYKAAIKRFFSDVKFDLVLYSTPPITLVSAIEYVKKRDGARTYLLLKDIFPQNAVDLGLISTTGCKGILYRHFRKQEKKLYEISDCIGCMSQANVDYVLKHNSEINHEKVEVCPNSIDVIDKSVDAETKGLIRRKYNIPLNKKVFIYGGNLGKPQGIPFLIECLKQCKDLDCFFLIVGDGTEYHLLEEYVTSMRQQNVKVMQRLPKQDYDTMVGACDVGLIFLDHRFSIPNFPSRLLSYMQARIPILACTDPNTDVGRTIVDGGFGWWCESDSPDDFLATIQTVMKEDVSTFGNNGFDYLQNNYSSQKGYRIITRNHTVMTEE